MTIDLPRPAPEKGNPTQARDVSTIQKLYADPTARHLLVTTSSGETFYLPVSPGNSAVQSRRPRPLRLRQMITSVAWSPISGTLSDAQTESAKGDAITPPPTDVLLGTSTGQILSLPLPPQDDIFKSVSISMSKPLERDLQTVYNLPELQPITGLSFGFWRDGAKGGKGRTAWTIFTTKERMYEVQGDVSSTTAGGKTGGWAEELFKPVRDRAPSESLYLTALTTRISRTPGRCGLIRTQSVPPNKRGSSGFVPAAAFRFGLDYRCGQSL